MVSKVTSKTLNSFHFVSENSNDKEKALKARHIINDQQTSKALNKFNINYKHMFDEACDESVLTVSDSIQDVTTINVKN